MSKRTLFEELHVAFFVQSALSPSISSKLQKTFRSSIFRKKLAQAVRRLIRRFGLAKFVRTIISQ